MPMMNDLKGLAHEVTQGRNAYMFIMSKERHDGCGIAVIDGELILNGVTLSHGDMQAMKVILYALTKGS